MIFNTCRLDNTVQEFMVFCWYRGCWPRETLLNSQDKWLYILRDLNDEGITWSDAYKKDEDGKLTEDKWSRLAQGTGKAMAEMFKDITEFEPIPQDQ